jgi:hypothetical protein
MTVLDSPNTRPAAIHPSRLRAPARNAEVRENFDNYGCNGGSKIRKWTLPCTEIGVRFARNGATYPCTLHKGQLPPIEIP